MEVLRLLGFLGKFRRMGLAKRGALRGGDCEGVLVVQMECTGDVDISEWI